MERKKTYYYLESIYLDNKNIIFEGKAELDKKPKNINTKMKDGEIYLDWYDSSESLIYDRKLISNFNKFYLPCTYRKAKETYLKGFELIVSYKPSDDGTRPFFYIVKKGTYRSNFDDILSYFRSIHQNKDFNFFAHRSSKELLERKVAIEVKENKQIIRNKKITTTIHNSFYRNFCLGVNIKIGNEEKIIYLENVIDNDFQWNYNFVDSKKYTIAEIENEIEYFQHDKKIHKYLKELSSDGKLYICRIARHTRTEIKP